MVSGKSEAIIIVPDDCKPVELYAAEELQYHIRESTGAELEIIKESEGEFVHGKTKVYVGNTRGLAKLGIEIRQPEPFSWNREDYAWAGAVSGNHLYFYGIDGDGPVTGSESPRASHESMPLGTLFAIYDFLENEIGVRWVWPGKSGEIIPRKQDIVVFSYHQEGMPRFVNTYWRAWHVYAVDRQGWTEETRDNFLREQRQWLTRHRFRRLSPIASFEGLIGVRETTYHRTHPGIVAMTPDGKRGVYYQSDKAYFSGHGWRKVAQCVSNPDLPGLLLDYWKSTYSVRKKFSNTNIVPAGENDIPAYCICEECRSWDAPDERFDQNIYWRGEVVPKTANDLWAWLSRLNGNSPSVTDRYAKYWLNVLRVAKEWNPDAKVYAIAYLNYSEPPKETCLNEDILVGMVNWPYLTWTQEDNERAIKQWDAWRASGAGMITRPNTTYNGHNLPVFYGRKWAELFGHAANNGLLGTDLDALFGQWATQGPNLYIIGRMHYRPDLAVETILDEYYSAFGPAKDQVRAYFEHWEEISNQLTDAAVEAQRREMRELWEQYGTPWTNRLVLASYQFSPESLAEGRRLIESAVRAAQQDENAIGRVRMLELGLTNVEMTLDALDAYWKFVKNRESRVREKLEAKVSDLMAFRANYERELNINLAWLYNEERGLWSAVRLDNLKPMQSASEIEVNAE